MTIQKPASINVIGWIIVILGIIFLLAATVIFLGKTVLADQLEETVNRFFDFESLVLFLTLLAFRAVYHIVMGIAIIKGQNWGRMWFLWLSGIEIIIGLFELDLSDAARGILFLIFLFFLTRPHISRYFGRVRVPFKYTFKSLFSRPLTTILTVLGISLVSFLFCGVLMLADGIKKVLIATGEEDNVVFMEENQLQAAFSNLTPEEVDQLENLGYYVFDDEMGEQLFSPELELSLSIPTKSDTTNLKNVGLRGVTELAPKLRRNFELLEGEMYDMGLPTCIVGRQTAQKMANCNVDDSININSDYYHVKGVFTTGGTIYDSEIWADIYSVRDSYNRAGVGGSIVLARLEDKALIEDLKETLESMPDLEVRAFIEQEYYGNQSENTTLFLKYLGMFICIVFAIGATIGAMITMYSAVANRTGDIATMKALGFQPEGIQAAFLIESMVIGSLGAVIGIGVASILSNFELQMFSTTNFFGEFYLKMTLTMLTVLYTFVFAISMGFVGGVFPSIKATRMKIIDAFR